MLARPRLGDRSLFPDLRARCYLNHAAVHPPSTPVRRAVADALTAGATLGVGAVEGWMAAAERCKAAVGALIGGASRDVALVPNTSAGLSAIARGFPWRRGDRVALFSGQFPAQVTPWLRAAAAHDLDVVWLPMDAFRGDAGAGLTALRDALRHPRGIRVVALSAVQFQTGLRLPWEAMATLAAEHDAAVVLDAIQACGVVPVDVSAAPVDWVAAGGHKWLGGVPGSGFLWGRRERWQQLSTDSASWLSHEEPLDFLFAPDRLRYDKPLVQGPELLEGGMVGALGAAGLGAGIDLLLDLGVHAIHEHVQAYLDALEPALAELGLRSLRDARGRSGILTVRPPSGRPATDLAGALADRGVAVSTPDGLLRFAPHWPNALTEVPHVVAACAEVLSG